jgi:hypothetical protein
MKNRLPGQYAALFLTAAAATTALFGGTSNAMAQEQGGVDVCAGLTKTQCAKEHAAGAAREAAWRKKYLVSPQSQSQQPASNAQTGTITTTGTRGCSRVGDKRSGNCGPSW